MQTWFVDYETYYDKDYSLRKMTPVEYVLDNRFECIGAAVKNGINGQAYWIDGDKLPAFFATLDPKDTMLVSHNALFDACITAWRYGFIPKLTTCTLSIARATLGHRLRSLSLDKVARELNLGVKGHTVQQVVGMGSAAIKAAGLYQAYTEYCLNDVELCAGIFKKLVHEGQFPVNELVLLDRVIRCAIQPRFKLDQNVLAQHLHTIKSHKDHLLTQAMMIGLDGKADLMSNEKFAEMLRSLGVEPPMKTSLATGKETYAFAKTDPAFIELEEHENPAVQALVAARMGHKTTLEESRTERFLNIARLTWPGNQQGLMPMPLRYSGAHTHRLSGDWKLNVQNMPRGGALRRALIAPPGHKVVAVDASQIEARIVAWLAGQRDLMQQFENGEDVYSIFASKIFGRPIDKKVDKVERFIGKTAILGLGYGLGWTKFQRTIKLQSKAQTGTMVELSDAEAIKIVDTYRKEAYPAIPLKWKELNSAIDILAQGGSFQVGPCTFEKGAISLPNGLKLHYHKLHRKEDGFWYEYAGKPKRLYGGSLMENISQALARIVVMDAAMRLDRRFSRFGIGFALQVHDELVFVVPEQAAPLVKAICLEEMRRRPAWAPTLPLDAEADIGDNYGDAK
jgi:hypothetical protein